MLSPVHWLGTMMIFSALSIPFNIVFIHRRCCEHPYLPVRSRVGREMKPPMPRPLAKLRPAVSSAAMDVFL